MEKFNCIIKPVPTKFIVDKYGNEFELKKIRDEIYSMFNKDWTNFYKDDKQDMFLYETIVKECQETEEFDFTDVDEDAFSLTIYWGLHQFTLNKIYDVLSEIYYDEEE